MAKESLNRRHQLIKFTCYGNILTEFVEEKILADIIYSNGIDKLGLDEKLF